RFEVRQWTCCFSASEQREAIRRMGQHRVLGKRLRGLLQSKYPAYAESKYAKCSQGEAEPHGRRYENGGARGGDRREKRPRPDCRRRRQRAKGLRATAAEMGL